MIKSKDNESKSKRSRINCKNTKGSETSQYLRSKSKETSIVVASEFDVGKKII